MPRFICTLSGQVKKDAIADITQLIATEVAARLRQEQACSNFDVLLGVDATRDDIVDGLIYTVWSDQESCRRFFDTPEVAVAMLPLVGYLKTAPVVAGYEPVPGIVDGS